MGKRTRKSTALVSLVLVPLNLMALGFTGCDSRDDNADFSASATAGDEAGDASAAGDFAAGDFEDPDDPFNLDPLPAGAEVRGPTTFPTTQPLGGSAFSALPPNPANHYRSTHYGPGVLFLPIPFRIGYQPPYRAGYRSSPSSSSVFRSSPGRSSSSVSHSSSTSRGGFGSSAASHSASS